MPFPTRLSMWNPRFPHLLIFAMTAHAAAITELSDPNPAPGNEFGHTVLPLPSGNVVVTSPGDDSAGLDSGAVYLFDGGTRQLISTLTGASAGDRAGGGGVVLLESGHFVILSPQFDQGPAVDAGAVTWGHGTTGIVGVIGTTNSLTGGSTGDQIGSRGVLALSSGAFLVASPKWDAPGASDAGAVTWCPGDGSLTGPVSAANSLVGSHPSDSVGSGGMVAVGTGNAVVVSPGWDHDGAIDAGAVTWVNGSSGLTGAVSSANSLVGDGPDDLVGGGDLTASGVRPLATGHYAVISANWGFDSGAVTLAHGDAGISGIVGPENSLVGNGGSQVGSGGIRELGNGAVVVLSPGWDSTVAANAGAATWMEAASPVTGAVDSANSLVGTSVADAVGTSFTLLAGGNFVILSPNWDNGSISNVGAASFGSGAAGVAGFVSPANSLVGSTSGDRVGLGAVALANGHYVVRSPNWDNGAVKDVGAATWCNGTSGSGGAVSTANSIVGASANDEVSGGGVLALAQGNYVVLSPFWDSLSAINAGAATWCPGGSSTSAIVGPGNSLTGGGPADTVSGNGAHALPNGHYVVVSSFWDAPSTLNVGAVTWCDGATGRSGNVSPANSLIGSSENDQVGSAGVWVLPSGDYVVRSAGWDGTGGFDTGAMTWCSGAGGVSGAVTQANSLVGANAGDFLGGHDPVPLVTGGLVARAPFYDNGAANNAGALTPVHTASNATGAIGPGNSLTGASALDQAGFESQSVVPFPGGSYAAAIFSWDDAGASRGNAGAVAFGPAGSGAVGSVADTDHVSGGAANAALQSVVRDPYFGRFFVRFLADGGGRVIIGSQATGFAPPAVLSFADWADAAGLTEGNAAPDAIPFFDGVPNLLKFAFRLNGFAADMRVHQLGSNAGGLPLIQASGPPENRTLRIEFLRRRTNVLAYAPQVSFTLLPSGWEPVTSSPVVTVIDAEWERVVHTEPLPPGTSAGFGRVSVSQP